MARAKKATAIKLEGMADVLKQMRYLPTEQGDQLRRASTAIAETVVHDAQGQSHTAQAEPVLASMRAHRYRIPEVAFGGAGRAGVSGGARIGELLGANFGTNGRYPQFPARREPDYYVYRAIQARASWITREWMDAVGRALATVDPAARH
jgi:hypothetical protein